MADYPIMERSERKLLGRAIEIHPEDSQRLAEGQVLSNVAGLKNWTYDPVRMEVAVKLDNDQRVIMPARTLTNPFVTLDFKTGEAFKPVPSEVSYSPMDKAFFEAAMEWGMQKTLLQKRGRDFADTVRKFPETAANTLKNLPADMAVGAVRNLFHPVEAIKKMVAAADKMKAGTAKLAAVAITVGVMMSSPGGISIEKVQEAAPAAMKVLFDASARDYVGKPMEESLEKLATLSGKVPEGKATFETLSDLKERIAAEKQASGVIKVALSAMDGGHQAIPGTPDAKQKAMAKEIQNAVGEILQKGGTVTIKVDGSSVSVQSAGPGGL